MPSSTTSNRYYIVYVLESYKDKRRYTGLTTNLKRRIREHNSGKCFSTNFRKPFKLIYAELCLSFTDAKRREHYLKTTGGRRFLAKRLKDYYLA